MTSNETRERETGKRRSGNKIPELTTSSVLTLTVTHPCPLFRVNWLQHQSQRLIITHLTLNFNSIAGELVIFLLRSSFPALRAVPALSYSHLNIPIIARQQEKWTPIPTPNKPLKTLPQMRSRKKVMSCLADQV